MIKDVVRWLRRLALRATCDHGSVMPLHIRCMGSRLKGATMGWDGRLTRAWDQDWRCGRCGAEWTVEGVVDSAWLDERLNPECYDAAGHPIDPATGRRLTAAS